MDVMVTSVWENRSFLWGDMERRRKYKLDVHGTSRNSQEYTNRMNGKCRKARDEGGNVRVTARGEG